MEDNPKSLESEEVIIEPVVSEKEDTSKMEDNPKLDDNSKKDVSESHNGAEQKGVKIGSIFENDGFAEVASESANSSPELASESSDSELAGEGKNILYSILIIVGVLALMIGGFFVYNNMTGADIVTIEDLHDENLEGNLDEEEGYVYHGFSFIKTDGLWWTDVKVFDKIKRIPLHFGPKEVENIPISGKLDSAFNKGNDVYIAIDPYVANKYYTLSISEISFNMAQGIGRFPIGSCTKEDAACDNRTIVSCEDTQGKPVVEFSLNNETSIEYIGTCIKISGNGYDLVKATDLILYKWYGVMD
jgi:hypothetical protein